MIFTWVDETLEMFGDFVYHNHYISLYVREFNCGLLKFCCWCHEQLSVDSIFFPRCLILTRNLQGDGPDPAFSHPTWDATHEVTTESTKF